MPEVSIYTDSLAVAKDLHRKTWPEGNKIGRLVTRFGERMYGWISLSRLRE